MFEHWLSITLWKRVFLGLALGLILGLGLHYGLRDGFILELADGIEIQRKISGSERAAVIADRWIKPMGDAFVRLIQMLVVPLITTTLIAGVTAMGDPRKLGSLGSRAIGLYFVTTLIAVSLGLIAGTIIRPGVGVDYGVASSDDVARIQNQLLSAEQAGGLVDRLLNIIPTNPISSLASGDVLQIIFFSIMVGVGILVAGDVAKPVRDFFESAAEVVMKVTMLVMELAPFGVFALIAWVMASKGITILGNLLWLAIALYLTCMVHIVLVYGVLIIKVLLRLPIRPFFRGALDAQGVAFSTASSSATLPVTITCAERNLGIEKSVAGSVLPLGATINMDGTSIYLGLVALFAAQAGNQDVTWSQYFTVALTATLVSIGAAGIPSAGLLLAATVLAVVGIDSTQALMVIAFIFPFDRLLDMMRSMTNVTGDLAVACAVGKWQGAMDESIYAAQEVS
jgi:Na+/H+-dicarboxylate symporter